MKLETYLLLKVWAAGIVIVGCITLFIVGKYLDYKESKKKKKDGTVR